MADNFNISDIPPEAGPKSVEVPGDIADGTAGEIMTWDAGGVATNVGPGAATEVLTSNGAGAAPSFQAAGGGAVSSVFGRVGAVVAAASDYDASQVDNDSGVAGAFVDDALNTLGGAITALDSTDIGNASAVTGATVTAALNNLRVEQLATWGANDAIFPATDPAGTVDRNDHPLITFDDSLDEVILFEGIISEDYDQTLGTTQLSLRWAAASATAGNCRWVVQFEKLDDEGNNLDADNFSAGITSSPTAPATNGQLQYTNYSLSNAEMDNATAGDSFRIKITRTGTNVADTMVGDAQLLGVNLRSLI